MNSSVWAIWAVLAERGIKWIWVFLSNLWGWFFQLFEGIFFFFFNILKVSSFRKDFLLFSFEPKTERNISLFLPWRCNTFVGSSPTQGSMYFFLKSDLKWAFSDIPIHIWIKYITRHFKRTSYREKNIALGEAGTHDLFQGRITEIFRLFFGSSENSKNSFRN